MCAGFVLEFVQYFVHVNIELHSLRLLITQSPVLWKHGDEYFSAVSEEQEKLAVPTNTLDEHLAACVHG